MSVSQKKPSIPVKIHMSVDAKACIYRIKRFSILYPKQMEKAYFRLSQKTLGQVRHTVKQDGKRAFELPQLSELRKALYPKFPYAGFLNRKAATIFRTRRNVFGKRVQFSIGPSVPFAKAFHKWQHPQSQPLYPHQRRRMHIILYYRGRQDIEVPEQTEAVERDVITPLQAMNRKTLVQDVIKQFNTIMSETGMNKYKRGSSKSRARARGKAQRK